MFYPLKRNKELEEPYDVLFIYLQSKYRGILLKCKIGFRRSGLGPRFYIFNKFPSEVTEHILSSKVVFGHFRKDSNRMGWYNYEVNLLL